MATNQAILATAKAIWRLLEQAAPGSEFPAAKIRIFQARDFVEPLRLSEGISVFLYHITLNQALRSLPGRVTPGGNRARPPLHLDLHFLITPWSEVAGNQLALLGWAVRVLEDNPVIPASYLNEEFPGKEVFRPGESIELVLNPLPIQEMALLWENLRQVRAMPSVTYVARGVTIDS